MRTGVCAGIAGIVCVSFGVLLIGLKRAVSVPPTGYQRQNDVDDPRDSSSPLAAEQSAAVSTNHSVELSQLQKPSVSSSPSVTASPAPPAATDEIDQLLASDDEADDVGGGPASRPELRHEVIYDEVVSSPDAAHPVLPVTIHVSNGSNGSNGSEHTVSASDSEIAQRAHAVAAAAHATYVKAVCFALLVGCTICCYSIVDDQGNNCCDCD